MFFFQFPASKINQNEIDIAQEIAKNFRVIDRLLFLRGQKRRWQVPGSFEGTLKIVKGNRSDGDVKKITNVCLFAWNCLE